MGSLLAAYLIGSVPNAYLLTRLFRGPDIRRLGSRNGGATNVAASVGWLPGLLTLLGDVAKGYLSVLVAEMSSVPLVPLLAPAFAVAGHNWPIWLGFQGGGGLATFVGGCLALADWRLPLAGLILWGVLYLASRDHDRSAVQVCLLLPCIVAAARTSYETLVLAASSSLPILLRRLQSIREKMTRSSSGPQRRR